MNGVMRVSALILPNIVSSNTVFIKNPEEPSALYDGATAKTLAKQQFKCQHCNLSFLPDDLIELHHIDGNHNNWKPSNLEALHRQCHQHQIIHSLKRDKSGR